MRDRSKDMSEARSMLTGRIVDSYTNILTVKLFARARDEDAYVRDAIEQHTGHVPPLAAAQHAVRARAVDAQCHDGDRHRRRSRSCCGRAARSRSARWRWRCRWPGRSSTSSGWVAWQVTNIFENVGVVQEGMMTIAQPITLTDRPTRRSSRSRAARSRSRTCVRLRARATARRRASAHLP